MLFTNAPRKHLFDAFGVPVFADAGAAILLVLLLLMWGSGGPASILMALVVATVAFVSIVAHELGHAMAVRKLGYGRSEIVLSGLGGYCRWYGNPTNNHRIRIALAGPGVSLAVGVLALVVYVVMRDLVNGLAPLRMLLMATIWINLVWGVFNLLPIHPMDGGQALRAWMASRMPWRRALDRSLKVSMGFAAVGAVVALASNWIFATVLLAWMAFRNYNERESALGRAG
jgi:Zn-dependent protease